MNERDAYDALKPRLKGLDPQRVENVLSGGTPDVWYTHGAMEMKYLAAWPVREITPVRIQTLIERPEQVTWLTRRWMAGGPAYLMIRVERQYLLFTGPQSKSVRGGLTREALLSLAAWKTDEKGAGDWEALLAWLRWEPDKLPPEDAERMRSLMGIT